MTTVRTTAVVTAAPPPIDVRRIREDFPILRQSVRGKPLVYLDNAATTQKPQIVLDTLASYYTEINANINRGVHALSERATQAYEDARRTIQRFINADAAHEIIFTRNATEGVNLVAQTWGRRNVTEGDEVLISAMEHHANIVPWQMLCEEKGARLRVIPMNDAGELLLDEYEKLLTPRTKILAVTHMSNALGTVNPVAAMTRTAREHGVPVLLDGAQAVYHRAVDVQQLGCDFYVFSGHKLYGPTGIGVLYGRTELLEAMPPYQGGGDMIRSVTFEKTIYNSLPNKFEAGTPHIAGAVGLAAAVDYVTALRMDRIQRHEHDLLEYATDAFMRQPKVRLIGTAREKASVLSFIMDGVHPHDIGTVLDQEGIAIRTGHHCAQPVMQRFGIPATARASLACYNTREEIDELAAGLDRVRELFC